jgi:hypothetical protein
MNAFAAFTEMDAGLPAPLFAAAVINITLCSKQETFVYSCGTILHYARSVDGAAYGVTTTGLRCRAVRRTPIGHYVVGHHNHARVWRFTNRLNVGEQLSIMGSGWHCGCCLPY